MTIEDGGAGSTLNINSGGSLTNDQGYIGRGHNTKGTVTVDGAGSQWNNSSQLAVGESGNGTLNVKTVVLSLIRFGYIGR